MSMVRLIRMTIAAGSYDPRAGFARLHEMHFKAARPGPVKGNRRKLARRGVAHFQQQIYRKYHIWIPKRKIKVRFEREERATKAQRHVSVDFRTMRYHGRQWSATSAPSRVITFARKRRRSARRV
jgi:hypothetical protein